MMAGSSVGGATSAWMSLQPSQFGEWGWEQISSFVQRLTENPPVPDQQTVANIETMKTHVNDMLGEYNSGDSLSDEKLNEIAEYTCGSDPEVVALRNQNNTHISIIWEHLISKGITEEDALKMLGNEDN
jgi:hypothetical protein